MIFKMVHLKKNLKKSFKNRAKSRRTGRLAVRCLRSGSPRNTASNIKCAEFIHSWGGNLRKFQWRHREVGQGRERISGKCTESPLWITRACVPRELWVQCRASSLRLSRPGDEEGGCSYQLPAVSGWGSCWSGWQRC